MRSTKFWDPVPYHFQLWPVTILVSPVPYHFKLWPVTILVPCARYVIIAQPDSFVTRICIAALTVPCRYHYGAFLQSHYYHIFVTTTSG